MQEVLNQEQGKVLLRLARQAIGEQLGLVEEKPLPQDPGLDVEYGTFVTLKIGGALRGCIGNILPSGSVAEAIKRNALNAAFDDSRFSPLTAEELAKVHIDISVLSQPLLLDYSDEEDLIAKLQPGKDGVLLRLGMAGATFLPQVWEQLPDPQLFLGHLCQKAGLPATAWRDSHPEIHIYHVQCFAEEMS
ncbi:MAG: AmmeMemoRadiSam system protein A [Proteobacteria bacterium]|nr:AmmeMemoRadiSam system protein A [Pseudomonadota bacterium]MBU1417558.1 AmmeMemoRadiSam system protein A [Pseudomonadota bacterium]MBU1453095.1 AmmeMemoRadiSam system protein A [Pseudomonadota bacterium]